MVWPGRDPTPASSGCTFTVLVHTREAATRNMEKIQVIKVRGRWCGLAGGGSWKALIRRHHTTSKGAGVLPVATALVTWLMAVPSTQEAPCVLTAWPQAGRCQHQGKGEVDAGAAG